MKKIFTLVLSLGVLSSVFAQTGHSRTVVNDHSKTVIVVDHRGDDNARMERDKAAQIQKINREFDSKILQVQKNRRLRNAEKKRQIRSLEQQRTQQINMVNARYSHVNNGHDGKRY